MAAARPSLLTRRGPGPTMLLATSLAVLAGAFRPSALAQTEPAAPGEQRPIITVHTDLVVLAVNVVDRHGGFIAGLPREAFTVFEDGVPQSITHFESGQPPVTVGLVVDNSGSMRGKREHVVAAGLAFAKTANPQDEMFLVNFNEHVRMGLQGQLFTSDLSVLRTALGTIKVGGQTALYDAVAAALWHVSQGQHRKKVLIVVSDGADNASAGTLEDVIRLARRADAVIYTVGIFSNGDDANPGVLKRLAQETGGQRYLPKASSGVVVALDRIGRDIRAAYTIGYTPTNTRRDGRYRRLKVVVQAPGRGRVSVRTRAGYIAPSDESSDARGVVPTTPM